MTRLFPSCGWGQLGRDYLFYVKKRMRLNSDANVTVAETHKDTCTNEVQ